MASPITDGLQPTSDGLEHKMVFPFLSHFAPLAPHLLLSMLSNLIICVNEFHGRSNVLIPLPGKQYEKTLNDVTLHQ